ncbi:MAG: hypothetical protein FWE90_00535 [Defluviitaleaceae bacterium]|nr:hypothetical protein [Defluviitaleaceae bacterium]
MYLFHYYEKRRKPFLNLSDLTDEESIRLHTKLASENPNFAKRDDNGRYMLHRRIVEERAYAAFIKKGGKPQRKAPHYMILDTKAWEHCEWFLDFGVVKIPFEEFDNDTVSFTYGDSFPTFKPIFDEAPEYELYTYDEITNVIKNRGIPLRFVEDRPWYEPSYIEAQVWSDEIINNYR